MKILNFHQLNGESLYEVWHRCKEMLQNCQQHDLNVKQNIYSFYNRINVCKRELLDSQGPLTKKILATNNSLKENFMKHSNEYHNRSDDISCRRTFDDESSNGLASITSKLDTLDRSINKTN